MADIVQIIAVLWLTSSPKNMLARWMMSSKVTLEELTSNLLGVQIAAEEVCLYGGY